MRMYYDRWCDFRFETMQKKRRCPLSIRFSQDEEDLLRSKAQKQGVTITDLIKENLWKSLNEENQAS